MNLFFALTIGFCLGVAFTGGALAALERWRPDRTQVVTDLKATSLLWVKSLAYDVDHDDLTVIAGDSSEPFGYQEFTGETRELFLELQDYMRAMATILRQLDKLGEE